MSAFSATIGGLPASGKTTFLAALWHLITEKDVDSALRFHSLDSGDRRYLNEIAARWRSAKVQERTAVSGSKLISISLKRRGDGAKLQLAMPDVPGEEYQRMWEDRDCDASFASSIATGGLLFFIHADTIRAPKWVVDEVGLSQMLGLPVVENEPVAWHPRLAPTQVQVVGLLQLLREAPLDKGPRKLGIMLSAWDKVREEQLTPAAFIKYKMPMLWQYLEQNVDRWNWRAYGVSAQGADYDPAEDGGQKLDSAEQMRQKDHPSERISLVTEVAESHDLTEPLAWVME